MARSRRTFVCRTCGARPSGWAGKCPACGAWATVEEVAASDAVFAATVAAAGGDGGARPLQAVSADGAIPMPTGVDELDRVLGGGLTPGSVSLLGGEPGIGKSTLTLQVAAAVAGHGGSVLLVAGEEGAEQVAARAHRLGTIPPSLSILDGPSLASVVAAMETLRPQLAVIDSIQTVVVDDAEGAPGSVSQVRSVAERIATVARRVGTSVVLVGHVTKDGSLAGPRVVEHLVDTVLAFGGDRSSDLRFLRVVKHRFGPTTDLGLFEMTSGGLEAVADPSSRFLADRQPGLAGSVVVPSVDGRRPIMAEVQALTVESAGGGGGRQTVQGVDSRRLAIVAAVLTRRAGLPATHHDLYLSVAGGLSLTEPAVDLGLAVALASSIRDRPVDPGLVVCGEIGLGGEVRSAPQLALRLSEAHRLGFRAALVPPSAPDGPTGMSITRVATVAEAVELAARSPAGGR